MRQLVILGALAGCTKYVKHDNEGVACVGTAEAVSAAAGTGDEGQYFVAGDPVVITVVFPSGCDDGCAIDQAAACQVSLHRNKITLDAVASYKLPASCDQDDGVCTPLYTTCETDALEEGSYTLIWGDSAVTFTIPDDVGDTPCTSR